MRRFDGFTQTLPQMTVENTVGGANGCRHHWKIESANGPTSKGICKFCGAHQEFQNSPQKPTA